MAQYSFRELLDTFLDWKGNKGDVDQRATAVLLVNRAYLSVWMQHGFNDHRLPTQVQVTAVANQRIYPLPPYFGRLPDRVRQIRNVTTGATLGILSIDELQRDHPEQGTDLESAGDPYIAAIGGPVGVTVQPTSSGQALEVLSDNASDTDVKVLVEGLDSNSMYNETQVTLNGTTAVAIGTWKDPIINFSKAYPHGTTPATANTSSRGTVTLRTVTGASTLQQLLPEESAREFPSLILYPKPVTASEIIALPALRAPKRLLYDADEIPRFWSEALLERMKELSQVSDGATIGDQRLAGPEVVKLVSLDNAMQAPIRTRRFGG